MGRFDRVPEPVEATFEMNRVLREHGTEDLESLLETLEALGERHGSLARINVVGIEASGTDTEYRPTRRQKVERRHLLCQAGPGPGL